MSSIPNSEISHPLAPSRGLSPFQFAMLSSVLAVLGLSTIWFTVLYLWTLWMSDALKSIGMVVPVVSLVLILRVWRRLGWQAEGTWWGLVLLAVTMMLVRVQQQTIFMMVISPRWYTLLPPPSLVLWLYGSGVVLMFGGVRLYRAALFPIFLLWLANPVPHAFSVFVDMPLQHASAYVARTFAIHLGHTLTPDHLRLMFTPNFGMFIAPGCNGIRGSVTMGLIALIAGYVYRFRWFATALVVMGAVLLGYVFNLLRLCFLVLYYILALHFPSLQDKAENADYCIGAVLFLVATLLLFGVIHRLRDARGPEAPIPVASSDSSRRILKSQGSHYAQLSAMGVLVLVGFASMSRAKAAIHPYDHSIAAATVAHFPAQLGSYKLERSWNETALEGPLVYVWAEYAPADGGTPVTIGISPQLGWHDPLICHFTRGENPIWQGQLTLGTAGAVPIAFSSALYNDGVSQFIEASTICSGGTCGEIASNRKHFGFLYTRPDSNSLLNGDPGRPIPVVLRAETTDVLMPGDVAREKLTADLSRFVASVPLSELTRPYSHE